MIDTNALRGKIVEKGLNQAKVAEYLNMSQKTFYNKMNKGIFGSDEIEKMIKLLNIEDPLSIFFAK